jgi:hypothetical protein
MSHDHSALWQMDKQALIYATTFFLAWDERPGGRRSTPDA